VLIFDLWSRVNSTSFYDPQIDDCACVITGAGLKCVLITSTFCCFVASRAFIVKICKPVYQESCQKSYHFMLTLMMCREEEAAKARRLLRFSNDGKSKARSQTSGSDAEEMSTSFVPVGAGAVPGMGSRGGFMGGQAKLQATGVNEGVAEVDMDTQDLTTEPILGLCPDMCPGCNMSPSFKICGVLDICKKMEASGSIVGWSGYDPSAHRLISAS
jgi:hypothetical protein